MGLSTAAKNLALDELAAVAVFVSLHTADPGDSGTDEVAGGAYARKAVTWGAAAAGVLTKSNTPVLDVPAATTITHLGLWSAVSGGTFYGSGDISDETYGGAGTYTLSTLTITAT